MKNLILIVLLLGSMAYAQVPQAISFQGVARDSSGACRAGEHLTLSISILDNLTPENSVYSESDTATTDANGLFAIEIGRGDTISGDFSTIDWSTPKWVKIAEGVTLLGTVEMLTVPYAFHADSANWSDFTGFASNGKLTDSTGVEYLDFLGSNGSYNTRIRGRGPDHGLITLHDTNTNNSERVRIASESTQQGAGIMFLNGPNTINFLFSTFNADFPDHPAMALYDSTTVAKVSMFVNPANNYGELNFLDDNGAGLIRLLVDVNGNGFITAAGANGGIKAFTMPHPKQPNKNIVYASIEGPEAAAYERGTTALINGEAEIRFSEHFEIVANPETLPYSLTPWSADSKGLAVVERTATGFKVKELLQGEGNYEFNWEVKAVRKGHENFEVIRDRKNIEE